MDLGMCGSGVQDPRISVSRHQSIHGGMVEGHIISPRIQPGENDGDR